MHFRKLIKVLAFSLILTTAAAGVPAYAAQEEAGSLSFFVSLYSSGTGTTEDTAEDTDASAEGASADSDGVTDNADTSANESGTASDGSDSASETDGTGDEAVTSEGTDSASDSDTSGSSASESDTDQSGSDTSTQNKKNKNKKNKNKKNKKKTQEEKDAEKAEKKKQRLNEKWRASVKPYTVSTTKTVNSPYDTYHLIGDSSVASFTSWWNGYNVITSHYTRSKTKNMTDTTDTADIIAAASDPLVSSLISGTSNARSGLFEVLYKFDYANKTAETVDFTAQSTTASALTDLTQTDLTQTGTDLTGLIPAESVDTLLVEAYAKQFTAACAEETKDNTGTTSAVVFSYGQSDAEAGNFKAALEYVQEVEEAAAADDSNAYFVVSLLPTGDKQTDKKIRRYNRVLRTASSQNAHVHYIDVYEYAKKQKIYADGDLTEKESRKLYQRIRKMTARFNTEQAKEETTYAAQWNIPSGLGRVYTYMGWSKVTNRSSAQYSLRASYGEEYDADGFAKIQADTDRYVIACTTYFGKVGDLIDFTLSNGEVIHTIVGDIKNQKDEGCTILGHQYGQSIVEFVVNTSLWYGTSQTVAGFHPEWAGCSVSKVTNYGNISEQ